MPVGYVLIIGAMKCGTTTLFNLLSQHPAVAPCALKEPGFFAFDDVYANGMEWYEALFDVDHGVTRYLLDGSTDYTKQPYFPDAPQRIARLKGDVRLIYLMRDPLKRAESHALHVATNQVELDRTRRLDPPYGGLADGLPPSCLNIGRYATQLDPYKEYFDRGALMLGALEELSADPQSFADRAFAFLGLESCPVSFSKDIANERRYERATGEAHRAWSTLRSIAPLREAVKRVIPDESRHRLRARMAPKEKVEGRFELNEDERREVMATLNPELDRLRSEYGFDPDACWDLRPYRPKA
ncbi:MAG: hypothetical protein GC152_00600 [Alphaproteobacteria bacterium]|nr:hypothetical protein [Alphaproteobacteria bacterium]